jgi:hypothetical protein
MKVIETDDIILPLFSENLSTYVIPVLGNKKKLMFLKNLKIQRIANRNQKPRIPTKNELVYR